MDAVDFVVKWNKICNDRDGNCYECPIEIPCNMLRTNNITNKETIINMVETVRLTNVLGKEDQNEQS